jgi:hypothetical protein
MVRPAVSSAASSSPDSATRSIEVNSSFTATFSHLLNRAPSLHGLRMLFRHDWAVYSKPPFGGPEHVLRYLGAYTHRVAISNTRPVVLSHDNFTFRWRDSPTATRRGS